MDVTIYNSIQDIPQKTLDMISDSTPSSLSHEFWRVVELSNLNDFRYQYALFQDSQGTPVGLAGFYTVTTDIAIFAPRALRILLEQIRKLLPNFFKLRMLECGTPLTLNPPILLTDRDQSDEIVAAFHKTLLNLAKKHWIPLIVIRDFESDAAWQLPAFKKRGYHVVESLPNTYLEICWNTVDEYLAAMKSYYRSKLLRHLRKKTEEGMTCELREDFDDLAEILCSQWLTVHNQADEYQREVLTPEFYRQFSKQLGTRSKVLLFHQDNAIIGHALLLIEGDLLRWLYFGRSIACNDSLYIYVGYQVIETAINLGLSRIEMGLTTYSVKKDFGAQMTRLDMVLRSPYALINPFIGKGYALMNKIPIITNKNIFKERQNTAPLKHHGECVRSSGEPG